MEFRWVETERSRDVLYGSYRTRIKYTGMIRTGTYDTSTDVTDDDVVPGAADGGGERAAAQVPGGGDDRPPGVYVINICGVICLRI